MFVALVDNRCGVVNVLETAEGNATTGKRDEGAMLSHDLNVVHTIKIFEGVDVVTRDFARSFDVNITEMHTDLLVLRGATVDVFW